MHLTLKTPEAADRHLDAGVTTMAVKDNAGRLFLMKRTATGLQSLAYSDNGESPEYPLAILADSSL